ASADRTAGLHHVEQAFLPGPRAGADPDLTRADPVQRIPRSAAHEYDGALVVGAARRELRDALDRRPPQPAEQGIALYDRTGVERHALYPSEDTLSSVAPEGAGLYYSRLPLRGVFSYGDVIRCHVARSHSPCSVSHCAVWSPPARPRSTRSNRTARSGSGRCWTSGSCAAGPRRAGPTSAPASRASAVNP